MPFTKKQRIIDECKRARKGRRPYRCESDWCPNCSQARTEQLTAIAYEAIQNPVFTTIILGFAKSYAECQVMFRKAIGDLLCPSYRALLFLEVAPPYPHRTDYYVDLMRDLKHAPGKRLVAHIHGLQSGIRDDLSELYPAKYQVKQIPLGQGIYANQTMKQNVANTLLYSRKRVYVLKEWWINSTGIEQDGFWISNRNAIPVSQAIKAYDQDRSLFMETKMDGLGAVESFERWSIIE